MLYIKCRAFYFLSIKSQQHGSVWWSKDAEDRLSKLSSDEFLHTQLATAFVADSPVWMDSSTSADCRALEEAVGGPEVNITINLGP